MSLHGNLEDFSLSDIFQLVSYSKKDGQLRLSRGEDWGGVWFHDGQIVFAQSNTLDALLGERLVRAHKITRRTLKRALASVASADERRERLGRVLVDGGYVSEEVLAEFVTEQVRETVFDLMRWAGGEFDFEVMAEAPKEDIGPALSIENIIMEGSRRLEEWATIERKIPTTDVVLMLSPAPGRGEVDISLKPAEWALIPLIDGRRSVREIAFDAGQSEFDVARILYGLLSAGLLEFAGLGDEESWEAEEEPAPAPEPEAAPEPESAPEPELESESAPAPEAEIAPESTPEPALEVESEPKVEVESVPEVESGLEPEPEVEPAPASAPEPESAPEPSPAPEVVTAPASEPEPEVVVADEPEPAEPAEEPQPAPSAQPEADLDLVSETEVAEVLHSESVLGGPDAREDAYVYESEPAPGFALASGLSEELSALTGAERRSRPSAAAIPDSSAEDGEPLRSHTKISRETLLRIAATLRKR
ncbi:MAG: DUF4388 domain-containing protein [Coriobacteriia bacterium]